MLPNTFYTVPNLIEHMKQMYPDKDFFLVPIPGVDLSRHPVIGQVDKPKQETEKAENEATPSTT